MDENYSNVIGSLSTDELKDIYLYRFLEYNEDFVSSCYIELTQNRGVTPDQLDTEIKKIASYNLYNVVRNLRLSGKTESEIKRYMEHYRIHDYDEVLGEVQEAENEEKKKELNNQIIKGLVLCGVVLLFYCFGYEIMLFHLIPVSSILLVVGAGITIVGLVKKSFID